MILNSNTLEKINKKMIIEMDKVSYGNTPRIGCALYLDFIIDGKIESTLDEEFEKSMKKPIEQFNSINRRNYEADCRYNKNGKYIIFRSCEQREFLIKELYATAIVCKYPTFLRMNDQYFFLNELLFTEHDKNQELELVSEKYEEIDCFIIENLYGIDKLAKKGYKKEEKEYKLINP